MSPKWEREVHFGAETPEPSLLRHTAGVSAFLGPDSADDLPRLPI